MAIDYATIARANEPLVPGLSRVGAEGFADRYSDPTHFVYELLQNAEDALNERNESQPTDTLPRSAQFVLFKDRLEFRHFGTPFAEQHVRAICDVHRSSKQKSPGAIGHFGIGFKSVYAFTQSPEVHSADESFVIESLVIPKAVARRPMKTGETLFVLPFNHASTRAEECHNIIAGRLSRLGLRTLLFLPCLEEIDWHVEGARFGRYLRESKRVEEGARRITLVGEESGKATMEEHWLVFSRALENGGSANMEIAYQLQQTRAGHSLQVRRLRDSPLCVYFATDLQTSLGFLVQGPFHLTPTRDNIRRDDGWNKSLAKQAGSLVADSLQRLKHLGLLNLSALDAMPLEREPFEAEGANLFLPVYDAVLRALKNLPLLPGIANRWVSGNAGFLVRGRELTKIFSPDHIQKLLGCEKVPDWISPEITADKPSTRRLHVYIRDVLDADELDAERICSWIDAEFLRARDEAWFALFYGFLSKHEAIWGDGSKLRNQPFIRLADGSNVAPFAYDGSANAFLATDAETGPKTVHPKLARGEALKFLLKLGLRERDVVAEVLDDVLPQYEGDKEPTERQHVRNLLRVFRALGQEQSPDHAVLMERLKWTAFLRATNATTGKEEFQRPSALVYFTSPPLGEYFKGQSDAWFLAEPALSKKASARCWLVKLGISDAPSFVTRWEGQDQVAVQHYRRIPAGGRLESLTDYNLRGMENALTRIRKSSRTSRKEAAGHAHQLWSFLCSRSGGNGNDLPVEGCLRWKRFHHRRVEIERFDAFFVERLREAAWLPDRKGGFHKPCEMLVQELPASFERNAVLCGALHFRTPLAEKLKSAGLAPKLGKVLELAQADPDFAEEFYRAWRKRSTSGGVAGTMSNKEAMGGDSRPPDRSASGSGNGQPTEAQVAAAAVDEQSSANSRRLFNSDENRQPRRTDYLQTRLRVATETGRGVVTESQEVRDRRILLDRAGIELVRAFEKHAGRVVEELPHNHPGYDLHSKEPDSEEVQRCIEVKSTGSDWNGVLLSSRQFEEAQRLGERYWLYVVENAASPEARIFCIQNPAGLAEKFIFDSGWRDVAEASARSIDPG